MQADHNAFKGGGGGGGVVIPNYKNCENKSSLNSRLSPLMFSIGKGTVTDQSKFIEIKAKYDDYLI